VAFGIALAVLVAFVIRLKKRAFSVDVACGFLHGGVLAYSWSASLAKDW
jgi:hypothetical protein